MKISFKQTGYSLLEIFIALTISLIILAALLQIFLNAKNTYNLSTGFSQLQENAQFIEIYLSQKIRTCGYRTPPTSDNSFISMGTTFLTATPYVTGTSNTGPNSSDTLTIRYQGSGNGLGTPDGTVTDCLNNGVDANTMVTNIFSLTANNELQCQAINPNASIPNNTQIIMSGVENFQVLFGEDLNANSAVDRYVPPNYSFLNTNDVIAVRVGLLLRSALPILPFPQNISFYLAGQTYTPTVDKYFRIPVTFTILLRNFISNPE